MGAWRFRFLERAVPPPPPRRRERDGEERFERLEPRGEGAPPAPTAPPAAGRFDNLEIGDDSPASPRLARLPADVAAAYRRACPWCRELNDRERTLCRVCRRPLAAAPDDRPSPAAAPRQDVTLVLDGEVFSSGDPDLPADARVLIERIQAEGYRPELVAEWRNWRATRNRRAGAAAEAPGNAAARGSAEELYRAAGRPADEIALVWGQLRYLFPRGIGTLIFLLAVLLSFLLFVAR